MSTFHHLVSRAKHYLDPRTHIQAAVHLTQRAVYYANPVTQIKAAERAAHQVARTAQQAGQFTERQARKDYIKFNRITAFIAPVVTPILAFIGSLIPFFGLIIGPALSFAGAAIARVSDSVALRSQGVTGHENSQRARGKQNRTLKYGLFGSALGGLASAVGITPFASAPVVSSSGEPLADLANAGQDILPTVPTTSSAAGGGAAAAETTSSASTGILGTGITWANIASIASPAITVFQQVMKSLGIGQPVAAKQTVPGSEYGVVTDGSGSGAEGTGGVGAGGPLGDLVDNLAGLPLPIKLGAAALGAGAVVLAFTRGKK